ncbi:MAG: porin family protein [Flavisolibacter sp.]
MKKALSIILFVFMCGVTRAQVQLGVRAGANIATTKNLITFPENRLGWYAGLTSNIQIKDKYFLQTELIYSSKGDESESPFGSFNRSRRFNYLNLPILFGYHFDKKTSVLLGPEFGYLCEARLLIGRENNLNIKKEIPPRLDVGSSIGLQYTIIKYVGIEVRYTYGFNTLYSIDAVGNRYTERNGANRVFQMGVRYLIQP